MAGNCEECVYYDYDEEEDQFYCTVDPVFPAGRRLPDGPPSVKGRRYHGTGRPV